MTNVRDLINRSNTALLRSTPAYSEGLGQAGNMPLTLPANYLLATTPAAHNLPAIPANGFWPVDINSDGTITLAGAGSDLTVQKGNAIRYSTTADYPAANQVFIQFFGRYDFPGHGLNVGEYYYLADVTPQISTYQIATGSGSYDFSVNGTTITQAWTTDDRTTMELIRDAANANATIAAKASVAYDITNALLTVTEVNPDGGFTLTGTGTNVAIAQTQAPGTLGGITPSSPALSQPLLFVADATSVVFDSQRITRLNLQQELLQVIDITGGLTANTPLVFNLPGLQGVNRVTDLYCHDYTLNTQRLPSMVINLTGPTLTVSSSVNVPNVLSVSCKGAVVV